MTIRSIICLLFILPSPTLGISITHPAAIHILDFHNEIRSLVAQGKFKINNNLNAEPSSNMRKLVWDAKLAELAQNYVKDEHPTEPRNFLGESLHQNNYTTDQNDSPYFDAVNAMNEWKAELGNSSWSPNSIVCEDFKKIRNGLQMIRATTGSVGCAYHEKKMHGVLVCMYDGDMAKLAISEGTHEIYKVGKACSACPKDSNCDEKSGLCVGSSESIPENSSLASMILSRHNKERSRFANGNAISTSGSCTLRPASNMRKLTWDNELAWAAEQYAKSEAKEKRWNGGENIFYEVGGDSNPERIANSAMTAWLDEVLSKQWSLKDEIGEKQYIEMGNGLQMIWAYSDKIGCGLYQWYSENGLKKHANFVCRYGTTYFDYKQNVYLSGKTCKLCGTGMTCGSKDDESGLCVKK